MTLPGGFEVREGFVGADEGDRLLKALWEELAWKQYHIRLFGRRVPQPRLIAWCADPGVRYTYSGVTLEAADWHPLLAELRRRAGHACGEAFNSVLVNAYRDGRDAMGWHADNEPELGSRPTIASVSLGAPRHMLIRPRSGGRSIRIELEHGSLLVMSGASQERWRHSIPRIRRPMGLRINLTYRYVLGGA